MNTVSGEEKRREKAKKEGKGLRVLLLPLEGEKKRGKKGKKKRGKREKKKIGKRRKDS